MSTTETIAALAAQAGDLARIASGAFSNAGQMPIAPNKFKGTSTFGDVCEGNTGAPYDFDDAGAFRNPWEPAGLLGTALGTASLSTFKLASESDPGQLATLLDPVYKDDWQLYGVRFQVNLTAAGGPEDGLEVLKQTPPYTGCCYPVETCFFTRLTVRTGSLYVDAYGKVLDGATLNQGWVGHHLVNHGTPTKDGLRFFGTGQMDVRLALLYRGTGNHNKPVFEREPW